MVHVMKESWMFLLVHVILFGTPVGYWRSSEVVKTGGYT